MSPHLSNLVITMIGNFSEFDTYIDLLDNNHLSQKGNRMGFKRAISTLKQTDNFLGIEDKYSNFETSKYVILPIPYEETSTYGKGSKLGPQAILNASHEVELYDVVLGMETYKECGGITTIKPTKLGARTSKDLSKKLSEFVRKMLELNKFVITIGGEHTSVVGAIYAHIEKFPDLTILQFDAHSDLRDSYSGDKWNHACAMARVLDTYKGKLVQIGIRSVGPEELELRANISQRLITFHAHDVKDNPDKIHDIINHLGEKVYITFDCDVFDPSVIPATGTPEPGGLTWEWIDKFFHTLTKERRVVGFD
ncbi:MAG: agmatinase, partial [Candidatus Hydrogenedentes bacterium]|nr:agmatinase [Candidatus Hydrogenedentota bacterium]